jgi:hypothetical protein
MVAASWRGRADYPRIGRHYTLPPSGNDDPFTMAQRALRSHLQRGLWRTGCGDNSHVWHSPDGLPRRYAQSYRDVEELLAERGIDVDYVSMLDKIEYEKK